MVAERVDDGSVVAGGRCWCLFMGLRIPTAVDCKLVSPKEGRACKTVAGF
jgi:hypothetical protein